MIGLAFGPGLERFAAEHPNAIDYIEIPFELLRHNPKTVEAEKIAPIVLHCASMSIAGFVPPRGETVDQIRQWTERTKTPWIGEHLAFISADPLHKNGAALHDETTLTYTVCPQLSEEVLTSACDRYRSLQSKFPVPIIIENSPQYFSLPGSTMSILDFTIEFHRRSGAGMLLDLTHFMISSMNVGFDPRREILRLPLERVVEVHVSGLDVQEGTAWDDHAGVADETVLELLEIVCAEAAPHAVTFEYNWSPDLPDDLLLAQIDRVRGAIGHGA
ncbi:multinuclear non-heme iron-dependent oxidative enzyme ApyH [Rhizobium ruizarguesonis]|uniref:multinuclear non-heme iron-dependent oxidative enzyme ApyH n=1 Tax=Rhizobium ruizarguesonis TaxID=2081791 RepID=UPI0018D51FB2|nr:DUF692 family multinuclear iron-containing protein [Rhizobium ruizarguesonis]